MGGVSEDIFQYMGEQTVSLLNFQVSNLFGISKVWKREYMFSMVK